MVNWINFSLIWTDILDFFSLETYPSTLGDTGSCRYWLHPHIILHSCTCGLDSHPHFSHSCGPQTLGKCRFVLWSTERAANTNWEFIKHSVVLLLDSKHFFPFNLESDFPTKKKAWSKVCSKEVQKVSFYLHFPLTFPTLCQERLWLLPSSEVCTPLHVCLFYNLSQFQWLPL